MRRHSSLLPHYPGCTRMTGRVVANAAARFPPPSVLPSICLSSYVHSLAVLPSCRITDDSRLTTHDSRLTTHDSHIRLDSSTPRLLDSLDR